MIGSRKPPGCSGRRRAAGAQTSRSRLQVLHPLERHVQRRSPPAIAHSARPAAQHSTSARRSLQRHVRSDSLTRRCGGGRAAAAARCAARPPSDAHPVLAHRLLGRCSRRSTARGSRTAAAARRRRPRPHGGALIDSASSTIVDASGRSGSKMKVNAVERVRREALGPRDHREHDRLAQRAGAGEHRGRDDRRPRGAHGDRPHRAPAVDAERGRALLPAARDGVERVDDDGDHDRRDHHRQDHDRDRQAGARG